MNRRLTACAWALACALQWAGPAREAAAQASAVSDGVVRIGVLTDMSGVLSDLSGSGSATAVRMAVEDYGGKVLGKPIEVVDADHQNKPDVAANRAREWFDVQKVDMITDLTNSAAALAVLEIARQKQRVTIVNGAGTVRITNDACTPYSVHYAWDTYAMANSTARAIVRSGGDTWYFLTADYAFGHQIEKDVSEVVRAQGGTVVGTSRHPFNASDFSSFVLSAQASKAKIIGLANGGTDTMNAIKSAREFGLLDQGQRLAGLSVFITDIHGVGLQLAQGLLLTAAFYWDLDDATRKWSRRYFERMKKMPTAIQAANYSSTMHYLRSIEAAGTDAPDAVMAHMKGTKINDFYARGGVIRPDGRMVHEMYLVRVKPPARSKYPWDYYDVVSRVPADEAFQPLARSSCPLVKGK